MHELGEHLTETEEKYLQEAGFEVGTPGVFKGRGRASGERTFAPIAPEPLDQASVLRRLARVQGRVEVIVFDEFQNLRNRQIRPQLHDLVKALSDNHIKVQILFVGIAESDEDLLPLPPSSDYTEYKLRHYGAARIPRMSASEVEDLIEQRRNIFNVQFDPKVRSAIAEISSGYPSYAHSLALKSCNAWVNEHREDVMRAFGGLAVPLGGGTWVGPVIGAALTLWQGRSLVRKLIKLDLRIDNHFFSIALVQFLREFHNNYEKQANRLHDDLTSTDYALLHKIFLLLAEALEVGVSSGVLAGKVNVDESDVTKMLADRPELIAKHSNGENWQLAFSYLGPVVRAYDYLRQNQPEQFAKLLS
jgi:hypothetical protein